MTQCRTVLRLLSRPDDIIQVDQSIIGAAAAFIANVRQSEVFKGGNENRLFVGEDNSNEIQVSSWNWNPFFLE